MAFIQNELVLPVAGLAKGHIAVCVILAQSWNRGSECFVSAHCRSADVLQTSASMHHQGNPASAMLCCLTSMTTVNTHDASGSRPHSGASRRRGSPRCTAAHQCRTAQLLCLEKDQCENVEHQNASLDEVGFIDFSGFSPFQQVQ